MNAPNTSSFPAKLPPMMAQYVEYKRAYAECLLLFQVGDFYEIFFDDAVTVARTLNLTLTTRDKNAPHPIPMCGVPIGVVDAYLDRLVDAGYSVAVVSQTGANADGKGMFQRALDRIVTPGVRLLGAAAQSRQETFLAALHIESEHDAALCWSDAQSGVVKIREGLSAHSIIDEIGRVGPTELLMPTTLPADVPSTIATRLRRPELWARGAVIRKSVDVPTNTFAARAWPSIQGYATLGAAGRRAVRALVRHIDTVTVGALVSITSIEQARFDSMVLIDRTTRDNLELVRNLRDGSRTNTLLDVIDRTVSVGGARLLRQWIQAPSSDAIEILRRQEIVSSFERCTELRSQIRRSLASAAELDRVGARLELAIASPRELGAMRDTLVALTEIQSHLNSFAEASCAAMSESLSQSADARATVGTILSRSLVELPPLSSREGGIFREGFDEELDRLRALSQDGASWMTGLEIRERDRTGISSLKIKFNNVIGYFIEITKAHKEKVPPEYTLRQDTANALRYVTEELKSREHEVVGARDASLRREEKLLQELRSSLKEFAPLLRDLSQFLANLDVLSALAELAVSEGYTRPRIVEGSTLEIVEGRHPVVAALLRGQFVPNSLRLGEGDNRCVLLTGPNMGGKSTYLRQAALIVILAQLGSWVPARAVTLGVVDRIFARIGASDDMAEGESTFMVEMKEASHIVSTATQSSLVLIDEIGRGTSTTDGLAIAQAILEWIVEKIRCRTLFATHYHELTDYPDRNAAVVNMSVGSHDHDGEVVFTHEIRPGPANRSYGLEVARVAGLPSPLIARARECLQEHEHAKAGTVQLNLFAPRAIDGAKEREVESLRSFQNSIGEIDPQRMTPLEALVALDALVTQARKGGKR